MDGKDVSREVNKDKPYQIMIDYVRNGVVSGEMRPGDRLSGERELAEKLGISRNSVREGLRILENMGVTTSQHGAGHYISLNFDEPMTEMLSLIYTMKGMGRDDLTQFRYCLEREAMHLAVDNASEQHKRIIKAHLDALLAADNEKKRYEHDMALHMTLIEASRNDYLITTYRALTNVIEDHIPVFRGKIIEGMKSNDKLEDAHRRLVMGVVNSDLHMGLDGLTRHFEYIRKFKD
ncbi:MAG TPA: FadR family transcriptional regulator [Lachnospiraceae bacterium]|nr:FadR family transcriptional regulator [Lachnospiraceae bacterium]